VLFCKIHVGPMYQCCSRSQLAQVIMIICTIYYFSSINMDA